MERSDGNWVSTWAHEGVALVTMTNPEIRNFCSLGAVEELADALGWARGKGARVAVLASGVPGHWYEHAWLSDLLAMLTGRPTTGKPDAFFRALAEIGHVDLVTIAAISGDCSGGGAELGWACDLRVAEQQARFGQPEVMIGLATGIGGTCRVSRLMGRTAAAEFVLDGAPLPASRVYELGGVNRVVAPGHAVEVALEWARRLAARPPKSLRTLKEMLNDSDDLHLDDAMKNEQKLFQKLLLEKKTKEAMRAIQDRFDARETVRQVYGEPVSPRRPGARVARRRHLRARRRARASAP